MADNGRILLAVRVGEASEAPARTALWLAKQLGARLAVLYVATELRSVPEVAVATARDADSVREEMLRDIRERTEDWGREFLESQPFDIHIEEGDVAERVAAAAKALGADLVVAGTEARGGLTGMILGDTTREILRRSACPVVVVPPLAERG